MVKLNGDGMGKNLSWTEILKVLVQTLLGLGCIWLVMFFFVNKMDGEYVQGFFILVSLSILRAFGIDPQPLFKTFLKK